MATQVQFRGGNTNDNENFTGAEREVTVDTGKQTLVVHNGTEEGGFPLLRAEDGAQDFSTTGNVSAVDGTFTGATTLTGDLTINTDALFVDASAKQVGIGTDSPSAPLDVNGTASFGDMANGWGFQVNTSDLSFRPPDANGAGSNAFVIYADGAAATDKTAWITKEGTASFSHTGTTTPTNQITLLTPSLTGTGGGSGIFLKTSQSEAENRYGSRIHTIREATPNNGASSLVISNENSGATGIEEVLRIDSSGRITLPTGSPGIQFGSPDNPAADGGIDISSQTLDDYEEGTFTPTLSKWTIGDMDVTHTVQDGRYTKIGDVVHIKIYLITEAGIDWTNSSGAIQVRGFPFAFGDNNMGIDKGYFRYQDSNTDHYPDDFLWFGYSSFIYGSEASTNTNWTTTFDGTSEIRFELTYTTSAL